MRGHSNGTHASEDLCRFTRTRRPGDLSKDKHLNRDLMTEKRIEMF